MANHYKNLHMQYTDFFCCKDQKSFRKSFDIFQIFAQNICGNKLGPARQTSTHNLCFGAKIKKKIIGIPLFTPVLPYKCWGYAVYITQICYLDATSNCILYIAWVCFLGVKDLISDLAKIALEIGIILVDKHYDF